jgi:2OG-Fe(II) oxygenase superfamily
MSSAGRSLTIELFKGRADEYRGRFMAAKPFKYVVIDEFLPADFAERIVRSFPPPADEWDGTTYIHQRKKFVLTRDLPRECEEFFQLSADPEWLEIISRITGIQGLIPDLTLQGGGLHQSVSGGFLDVHVDFNRHPETKLHRRLNLICYLNKEWRREYEGYLELWDMSRHRRVEMIAPTFNRCVIFETNEISYHGHPKPLRTPRGITRKSLSVYYYTCARDPVEVAEEHNTVYRHTEGIRSYLKTGKSSLLALCERTRRGGGLVVIREAPGRLLRLLRRTAPPNR